jgi:hypothetical protein
MGCSAKLTGDKSFQPRSSNPYVFQVTALKDSPDSERIKIISNLVSHELKQKGYLLLDQEYVDRTCKEEAKKTSIIISNNSTPFTCDPLKTFIEQDIDGVITLSISKVSTNDFTLGFFNYVTGSLTISDINGKEKLKSTFTQRERGGLLFDSGQVIVSFRDQMTNGGEEGFHSVATRFSRSLVQVLPKPFYNDSNVVVGDLRGINIQMLNEKEISICAEGTPGLEARLHFSGLRTELREELPGKYCGIFLYDSEWKNPEISLKTSFGSEVRKPITLPSYPICNLSEFIRAEKSKGKELEVSVRCVFPKKPISEKSHNAKLSPLKGKDSKDITPSFESELIRCQTLSGSCFIKNIYLYESAHEDGPFGKPIKLFNAKTTIRPKNLLISAIAEGVGARFSEPYIIQQSLNSK